MRKSNTRLMVILAIACMIFTSSLIIMPGANAASFGADSRVNDAGSASFTQSAPDMAIDQNDNIYVVWEDDRSGDYDIYISESTDDGENFQADIQIDDHTADQQNPAIVIHDTDDVYVTWQDFRDGDWDIYFAKSTNGGASFGTPERVSDAGVDEEQSYPNIAVAGNDNIYIVWQDYRNGNWDIFSAVSTDDGDSFDTNVRVNSNPSPTVDQKFPSVAVSSNDAIFVVWQDDRNGDDDIYSARSTNDGDSFQTEIRVNDDTDDEDQRYPTLAINDSDSIYVVWEDYRSGSDWDIYLAKSTNNGNAFDANVMVNDASNDNQRRPSLSVDADDNIHVAWYDRRSGDDHVYYAKSTDAGDSFGTDTRECSTSGVASSQYAPAVAVNSGMDAGITWADSRDGDEDIYFSRGVNSQPTCAITIPAADATVSGTTDVSGTASDPDGNEELVEIEVRVDTGVWETVVGTTSWSYALNTNSLTNGLHTIYARAYDGDLYSSISSVSVDVNNPSNRAPSVTIWAPASGSTLSGSEAVIAGNATDPDGDLIDLVQVRIDNGNWIDARGTNGWAAWVYSLDTTTLSNGQHTIYARAYDGALYSDLSSVIIFVANAGGNVAPTVSITKPLNEEKITDNLLQIEATATDPDGNAQIELVQVKIDDGSWEDATPAAGQDNLTAWNYYLDTSSLSLGEHTIYARAYDGNSYSTEASVTVTIAEPGGGSGTWILILIIILLLLLLLVLMRRRKEESDEFEMRPDEQYEWQDEVLEQQPPEEPPAPPPDELIEP